MSVEYRQYVEVIVTHNDTPITVFAISSIELQYQAMTMMTVPQQITANKTINQQEKKQITEALLSVFI
jgi:hypothetical protein